jgi:hypothetical protein
MEMVSNSADQRSGLLNVLKFILEKKALIFKWLVSKLVLNALS